MSRRNALLLQKVLLFLLSGQDGSSHCLVKLVLLNMLFSDNVSCQYYVVSVTDEWMNEYEALVNDGERKIVLRQNTCPKATLPTTNPTFSGLGLNMGNCSERPVTNCQSHGSATVTCCPDCDCHGSGSSSRPMLYQHIKLGHTPHPTLRYIKLWTTDTIIHQTIHELTCRVFTLS